MSGEAQIQLNATEKPKALSEARSGILQRKCGCGGSAGLTGECAECRKDRLLSKRYPLDKAAPAPPLQSLSGERGSSLTTSDHQAHSFDRVAVHNHASRKVQTRLAVSAPGDRDEQEADLAAEQVMASLSPAGPRPNLAEAAREESLAQRMPVDEQEASAASPVPAATPEVEAAPAGLLAEDEAGELAPGQMRRTEFLDELQGAVCAAADRELGAAGRTAQDCPYIEQWIGYYRTRSASQIERALRRYAPEAAGARDARGYISVVAERVGRAAFVWATTGEITGVPEGASAAPPEEGRSQEGGSQEGERSSAATGNLQLKQGAGQAERADDPASVRAHLSDGQSIDTGVRSRMESAFGYDFSRVRLHKDTQAAGLTAEMGARAFTLGTDIAFAAGEYQPGTLIGDALLAHELAHVIQQGGATADSPLQKGESGYGRLEEDADHSAIGAVASLWNGARSGLANITQNALPSLRSGLRLQMCKDKKEPPVKQPPEKPAPDAGDAKAGGCEASFAKATFALSNQTASGAKPAVNFLLGLNRGKAFLLMRGTAPAKYKPEITIGAPSDSEAKEFEVGIIQNLLSEKLEYTFTAGGPIRSTLPTPIKDGAPKSSGVFDEVFAENGGGHPNILVGFKAIGDKATLNLPDTPSDGAFINLKDNTECAASRSAGTMTKASFVDEFRTWVGVRHKPSGCVKTIHHIDWKVNWVATVDGAATPPTRTPTSDSIDVTQSNGDGSPTFIKGGDVPADLLATSKVCDS